MINLLKKITAIIILSLSSAAAPARGDIVIFDFDTGSPILFTGQNTPIEQTKGTIKAHFSSPEGAAFSIQSNATTNYVLSFFFGRYLWPNNNMLKYLDIKFNQQINGISLTFATIEYHDPQGQHSTIRMTAYNDSTATPPVGSVTAYGINIPGESYPQGIISFHSRKPFNLVQIVIPSQPLSATGFVADNITVSVKSIVDFNDFGLFSPHWRESGCSAPDYCGGADLNKNGTVDEQDLWYFSDNWLSDCPESWPWHCVIGFEDLTIFASHWLESDCISPDYCGGADLDQNGNVNSQDLNYLTSYWLCDCPANWPWQ